MDKESAINAMNGGYKVSHNLFSDNEYIWMVEEEFFINENGDWIIKDEFWENRQGDEWETGWKIIG